MSNQYDQPWLDDNKWTNGQIHSDAKKSFYVIFWFALIWNLFTFPLAYFTMADVYSGWHFNRFDPALAVLLFPFIGLVMANMAYKTYRQWATFGILNLTLDPYPGSIGGEVGGHIELPVPWKSGYNITVALNNVHHSISRSSNNSSHSQSVVYRKHCSVHYEPSSVGIRIYFKCPVEDLPEVHESEDAKGNSYYRWVVSIKSEFKKSQKPFNRDFDIPVFRMSSPQTSSLSVNTSIPTINAEDIQQEQVIIKKGSRSLDLFFPASRNRQMASTLR